MTSQTLLAYVAVAFAAAVVLAVYSLAVVRVRRNRTSRP
jgi:hypothetical protein